MGAGSGISPVSPAGTMNPDGTMTPMGQPSQNNSKNGFPSTLAEYYANQRNSGGAFTTDVKPFDAFIMNNPQFQRDEAGYASFLNNSEYNPPQSNFIGSPSVPSGNGMGGLYGAITNSGIGASAQPYMPIQAPLQAPNNSFTNSTDPYISAANATNAGNQYGAQTATAANRINQNTPYANLSYERGIDANGMPTYTANQTLNPQLDQLTRSSLAGLQSSQNNPMYGINPGQTYSDAIMSRLQPQLNQSNDRLQAQLANQGIEPGTEAYNRAMTLQGQKTNDAMTSAIVGGMQTGLQASQLQNQSAANIKALSNPGYINPYSQAAVSGPDYLGAYTTSQAAQIAAQNAKNAKAANLQTGLFGLGNSAIRGAGGVGNLAGSIFNGGKSIYDLFNASGSTADYMNSIGATGSGAFDPAMSSTDYLNNLYGDLGIF